MKSKEVLNPLVLTGAIPFLLVKMELTIFKFYRSETIDSINLSFFFNFLYRYKVKFKKFGPFF